jgi:hypothetical protein
VRCTWRLASTFNEGLAASTPTPMTCAFLQRCTSLVMTSRSMPMTTRTRSSAAMSCSPRRSWHAMSRRERTFLAAARSTFDSPAPSTAAVLGMDLYAMDAMDAQALRDARGSRVGGGARAQLGGSEGHSSGERSLEFINGNSGHGGHGLATATSGTAEAVV